MARGDKSAFAELVEHFQRPLFGCDPSRAQLSTSLFTSARNLAINELKRPAAAHEQADSEALTLGGGARFVTLEGKAHGQVVVVAVVAVAAVFWTQV